ncbi:uncharacterized protein M6B38_353175 [Iris pallida]|uniref:Uncharacterized protein n=1 Tax=Iris pallida TaxID=29817 RepID=A0AAX6GQP2_IRIPA|nr:uncharacterized protein M6B38_353175 [Iris pallida]
MDEHFRRQEEDLWKCRKHPCPSARRRISGVCPSCLRDRLLRLCPDCANLRPCPCPTSSSSSSSFSSISSSVDPPRSSVSGAIGAVGRVSSLIEIEPSFQRSRSVAFGGSRRTDGVGRSGSRKWWPFSKKEAEADFRDFSRSMGVVGKCSSSAEGSGEEVRGKVWKWHFPSPMRAFRHRKPASVVHERSPMCRG